MTRAQFWYTIVFYFQVRSINGELWNQTHCYVVFRYNILSQSSTFIPLHPVVNPLHPPHPSSPWLHTSPPPLQGENLPVFGPSCPPPPCSGMPISFLPLPSHSCHILHHLLLSGRHHVSLHVLFYTNLTTISAHWPCQDFLETQMFEPRDPFFLCVISSSLGSFKDQFLL